MATSVDPDETARYEPSHLDLHFLHMWLVGMKGLKMGHGKYIEYIEDIQTFFMNMTFISSSQVKKMFILWVAKPRNK